MVKFLMVILSFCTIAFSAERTIAVTYSILGSLTKELVGDKFNVEVIIPSGQDLHEWRPSAKEVQKMMKADLIVQNGANAEEGLEKPIERASQKGVKIFSASDYIQVRVFQGSHEGHNSIDPHFWLDPISMKAVMAGLTQTLKKDFGVDVSAKNIEIAKKLDELNAKILRQADTLAPQNKKLVTSHDALGYYAARYNFEVIGAIVPSFSTSAQASAAQVAKLEKQIKSANVKAIFTELGAPKQVENAIAKDTGAKVVIIDDHKLPPDGLYYTMISNLTTTIVDALK